MLLLLPWVKIICQMTYNYSATTLYLINYSQMSVPLIILDISLYAYKFGINKEAVKQAIH